MSSGRREAAGAPAAVAAALGVAAVGVYAWVASGLRPFTVPALVAILAGGAVAMAVGARLPPSSTSSRTDAAGGAWPWAVLAGAAALWQLQAFVQHPRAEHPTISSLTNELLDGRPSRAAALAAWLAAAAWLARR